MSTTRGLIVPAGTRSLFHLYRDSDEVAWVLAGKITFKIGDAVSVGGPGTCAFLPYIEELAKHPPGALDAGALRKSYRWEVVGPNPL